MELYVLVWIIFRKISYYFSNHLIFKMGTQRAVCYELKSLTLKQQSWYSNFSALFMKNVLLGHKKKL